jgi:hypothetical protein
MLKKKEVKKQGKSFEELKDANKILPCPQMLRIYKLLIELKRNNSWKSENFRACSWSC